jgi:hypothetical protein
MWNLILVLDTWIGDQAHWWTDSGWWLVGIGAVTAAFICWQSLETQRSAQASRKSVEALTEQTSILKASVDAAEKNADAARDSALTARIAAEAVQNSERAWVLAELGWIMGVMQVHSRTGNGQETGTTEISVKLTCKNEGRSPAWIDDVHVRADILSGRSELRNYLAHECGHFGPLAPIGPGNEISKMLHLSCDGIHTTDNYLSVYVLIEYHDIFELPRETRIGYSIEANKHLVRQMGARERNANT